MKAKLVHTANVRAHSTYTRESEKRQPPTPPPRPPQLLSIWGGPSTAMEPTKIQQNQRARPPGTTNRAASIIEISCLYVASPTRARNAQISKAGTLEGEEEDT